MYYFVQQSYKVLVVVSPEFCVVMVTMMTTLSVVMVTMMTSLSVVMVTMMTSLSVVMVTMMKSLKIKCCDDDICCHGSRCRHSSECRHSNRCCSLTVKTKSRELTQHYRSYVTCTTKTIVNTCSTIKTLLSVKLQILGKTSC